MTDLLIRGAILDGTASDIAISGGVIESIAPSTDAAAQAGRVIDAAGLHAFPSFRNAHTHVAMVLFRGYGDDMPLMEWLQTRIWPAEGRLSEQDVYNGARLGILEMIRGGTTFFNEMYWHRPALVRAVEDMGVRALVGQTLIDLGNPDLFAKQQKELERLAREERVRGRVTFAAAPHSIYTVPFDSLRRVAEISAEHDVLVHIHLSETAGEVQECVAKHGCRPAQLLERAGLVNERLVAVHGQFLDDAELDMLGAAGAALVTNPAANLKLATAGIARYGRARQAGVRVCLGTDGAASNNTLSMIESMKLAALLQKHQDADATALPARAALAMATTVAVDVFGAAAGGSSASTGNAASTPPRTTRSEDTSVAGALLVAGAPADLVLLDFSDAATQPVHDPVSTLVYAASAAHVHTTICDGGVLMYDRVVEVCDEVEVIDAARRSALAATRAAS